MVNSGTRAIRVPAADGRRRLWRDTAAARLPAGVELALPDATAPRVALGPRVVRASGGGAVRFPRPLRAQRVALPHQRAAQAGDRGRQLGQDRERGRTARITLKLKPGVLRRLKKQRRLRVRAQVNARDAAGNLRIDKG